MRNIFQAQDTRVLYTECLCSKPPQEISTCMFETLARFSFRRRWWLLLTGLFVIGIGATYGVGVFGALQSGGLLDPAAESSREAALVDQKFPDSRVSLLVLLSSKTLTVDQPEFRDAARQVLAAIKRDPTPQSITSYENTSEARFVSRDRHAAYAVVSLNGTAEQRADAYPRLRSEVPQTALSVSYGGPAVGDYEVNQQVQADLPRAGMISGPILLLLLLLIFRSAVAALLPLLIGAVSVLGAFALTRFLAHFVPMSVFASNIIGLLGLGLAIDYSLLFVSRFRDELAAGKSVAGCLDRTVRTAGESIFFSGCTVSISLLGMLAFPESFLRSMGIGGAIAVGCAMAASLTILPALLAVLGPRVNKGTVPLPRRQPQMDVQGFWFGFSHWVMRRALWVIPVTLALLLAAGIPFLHVRFANSGADSLPASFETRRTADALRENFTLGQEAPIEVVLTASGSPLTPANLVALSAYTDRLKRLPGVQNASSLVTLDSRIPAWAYPLFYADTTNADAGTARTRFASGNATLVVLDYTGDSQSPEAQTLVQAIRAVPLPPHTSALVGGDTAELVDRLHSLRVHAPLAGAVIIGATFILLFFLLSSLVVPLKAVVLNILSLAASFGLMAYLFQEGHGEKLLAFQSSGSLDVTLPVLIFCLAFGLATDYEVFLVSRIKEEYLRLGDNTEAIAIGVEKTGQIITSAALLLMVVVAAFGASRILAMKEIGVGLTIAVAIDAAVVRTLLVPATMKVFGDINWWLPGVLRRKTRET